MKRIYILLFAVLFVNISLAQTPVRIYLPANSTDAEQKAAHLLQQHILGSAISIEPSVADTHAIVLYVGKTNYASSHLSRLNELRDDGFCLKSNGRMAAIYGNKEKSVQYGAAHLLELMGHHMTWIDYQPQPRMVEQLPIADEVNNPSFAHREMWYYAPYHSQEYADWHGLHFRSDLNWSIFFVHTFQHLIPHQRYFDSHPEWFSEINGRRVRDGQLCLTNPEVLDTLCAHLSDSIARHPEAQIWSVSNNDNINGCQCPRCRHADSIYGGPSGTLIHFVNQVARRFPTKTISTLAYQYTRQAPKPVDGHIERPDSNVNIMFCSIECGREKPLSKDSTFAKDMEDWAALTSNIYMWDYVVQFRNFWNPFPNLHVLGPNLQFFRDNGVRWMFEQGSGAHNVTSWMELRQYLLAKLMWNADANPDSLIKDFCRHYYGPTSEEVISVIANMKNSVLRNQGKRLDIYGYPIDAIDTYLTPQMLEIYRREISHARGRIAPDDTLLRHRLRFFELSLDYARIELMMAGVLPMDSTFASLTNRFMTDGKTLGINILHEMGYSLEEYQADIDNYLAKSVQPNLARGCKVSLMSNPQPRYYALGAEGLTDGRCGQLDYRNRWLGFNPDTLEAIIDLGHRQSFHQVSLDFFFYPLSWIFLPQQINFYSSVNGKHWTLIDSIQPSNPEQLAIPQIFTFSSRPQKRRARYVKIVAEPLPSIPAWHRATGNTPWIFTDEIIVR
ncbi:MAG: DUF4838 domain-containing protein [Bacteroidales bacterium]|nr:DUF4838 domain-containing protein [Bacteroidales bacterium]